MTVEVVTLRNWRRRTGERMRQSLKVGPQLTPTDSTRVDFMMKELRTFAMTVKVIDYSIRELKASMVGSTGFLRVSTLTLTQNLPRIWSVDEGQSELNGDREESEGIGEEAIARYHANGEYEDGHHDDDSVEYASSDEYDFQREDALQQSIEREIQKEEQRSMEKPYPSSSLDNESESNSQGRVASKRRSKDTNEAETIKKLALQNADQEDITSSFRMRKFSKDSISLAEKFSKLADDAGKRLDEEVLLPIRDWMYVQKSLKKKIKELERRRIEVDARRRGCEVLRIRARNQAQQSAEKKLDKTIEKKKRKEAKLKAATEAYTTLEGEIFKQQVELAKGAEHFEEYIWSVVKISRDIWGVATK